MLQNPPFGVQKRGADRKFLKKALTTADTVYSLHKSVHDSEALVKRLKATGDGVCRFLLPLSWKDTSKNAADT